MDHLSNRRRKEIASLRYKKYRERLGQFVVEGVRSVEAAVEAGAPLVDVVVEEAVRDDPSVQAVLARLAPEVPVVAVSAEDMAALSNVETSQGLLAVARVEQCPEEKLMQARSVLALDGVQDPGNVGTLIRTAAWFGVEVVLAGPRTAGCFNPKVVRAAMGGLWDVDLARAEDLGATLDALQQKGFALYGADLAGTPASAWAPRAPAVVVVGSEAHGLSAAVLARLHERVSIPGGARRAGTESLNVAVAAGILMHAWLGSGRF